MDQQGISKIAKGANHQTHHSDLMTTKEAAQYLGLSEGTLPVWRCRGVGPEYVCIGRNKRYRRKALDAFIEKGTVKTDCAAQ